MSTEILRPVIRRLLKAQKFRRIGVICSEAQSYANAIKSAGVTITEDQRDALIAFIVEEKAAGRWDKLKRLRLMGWGAAAANSIDLVTLAAGTFSGTVTHATGYVQGNGSTGFLNTGANPGSDGLTDADFLLGILSYTAPSGTTPATFIGSYVSSTSYLQLTSYSSTQLRATVNSRDSFPTLSRSSHNGVILFSRAAGNDYLLRRSSSGVSYVMDASSSAAGLAAPSSSHFVMALNQQGATPTNQAHSDAKIGASFSGLALSKTDAEEFTANLATLWEALFGLALP